MTTAVATNLEGKKSRPRPSFPRPSVVRLHFVTNYPRGKGERGRERGMIANSMAHCESNTSRFYSVHSTQWPMPFEQTAQQWCRSRVQHHTQPAFACNKLGEVETEMVRVTHAHPPQGLDEMGKPQGPPAREGGKEGGRATACDIDHAPCTPIVHHFQSTSRVSPPP